MYKYIDNFKHFIRQGATRSFYLSAGLGALLNKTGYVKVSMSECEYFLKVTPCDSDDQNRNHLNNGTSFCMCELSSLLPEDFDYRMYAYGRDSHGGIIFRIYETDNEPTRFNVIKKETKKFVSMDNNRSKCRISNELVRALKYPKRVNVYHNRKSNRIYLTRATTTMGSYDVKFTQTSPNSGFYHINALNLIDYIEADVYDKFEVKKDRYGHFIDIDAGTIPKSRKGIRQVHG